jgi:hypothetical protein
MQLPHGVSRRRGPSVPGPKAGCTWGFGPALTPWVLASSPSLQPGGFFFWIWVRQAADSGFQADALVTSAAAVKIWQPTAVRTFFAGREE